MTHHQWDDDILNKTWNCLYFDNDHHFGKDRLRMHHSHPKSRILLDNICWFPIYFERDDISYSKSERIKSESQRSVDPWANSVISFLRSKRRFPASEFGREHLASPVSVKRSWIQSTIHERAQSHWSLKEGWDKFKLMFDISSILKLNLIFLFVDFDEKPPTD